AERVSAGETASVRRPSDARCALTSLITWFARSVRAALHDAPGVQSPASVVAGAGDGAVPRAVAATATRAASDVGRSRGGTSEAGTVDDQSAGARRFLSRSSHARQTAPARHARQRDVTFVMRNR